MCSILSRDKIEHTNYLGNSGLHVSINTVLNVSKNCNFLTHPPSPFADVIYGWSLSSFICEASKNTFTSRLLHHGSLTSKVDLASDSSLSYILWQRRNHPRRFGRKIHLKTGHVHAIQDITVYLGHQHICIYVHRR